MDTSGKDESKRKMQLLMNDDDHTEAKAIKEAKASLRKAIKEAKASLRKAETLAIEIGGALESVKLSDSNGEDNVLQSSTPSIRPGVISVEEKPIADDQVGKDAVDDMLKILLPQLFEKK